MQVFDHQAAALAEITARARAFFAGHWRDIPIRPRFHSLIVGPTGTGKTALASMAAESVGASLVRISVPGWMPAGASGRSVAETIATIAQAVERNERTLLALDELEKACAPASTSFSSSDSPWQQHCRLEIYDLLDGRWPHGLKLPNTDDDDNGSSASEALSRELLAQKLRETVFILGLGTFQAFFDSAPSRRTIGFQEDGHTTEEISLDVISEKLPRELTNRFCGLIRLPELREEHYRLIARQAEKSLPERMRQAFRLEIDRRIQSAISAKKGVRFLEEAMLEVLKSLPPEPPIKLPLPLLIPETDIIDTCIL